MENEWESSPERRARMAALRRRDTGPELALRKELHRRGRRFFVDRRPISASRSRADLLFPRARVAVFVDGCFWHWCEDHTHLPKSNAALWLEKLAANRQRDARTDALLQADGWRSIRVWEHEDTTIGADRVERALDDRSD